MEHRPTPVGVDSSVLQKHCPMAMSTCLHGATSTVSEEHVHVSCNGTRKTINKHPIISSCKRQECSTEQPAFSFPLLLMIKVATTARSGQRSGKVATSRATSQHNYHLSFINYHLKNYQLKRGSPHELSVNVTNLSAPVPIKRTILADICRDYT